MLANVPPNKNQGGFGLEDVNVGVGDGDADADGDVGAGGALATCSQISTPMMTHLMSRHPPKAEWGTQDLKRNVRAHSSSTLGPAVASRDDRKQNGAGDQGCKHRARSAPASCLHMLRIIHVCYSLTRHLQHECVHDA